MDRKSVLFAGLALAAAGNACAQNIEWRQAVYAEVLRMDHGGALEQVPFYPYSSEGELPQRVMQFSLQGVPGIVLAGGARIGDGPIHTAPTTPYVTKLDAGDGHVLWTWQPEPGASPEGRIRWSAIDASGAIFVVGLLRSDESELPRSLFAKLDGATGAELWRVTGDESTTAYAVVLDATGSAIVTSSEPNEDQRVSKYSAADRSLIWSHVIAGGRDFQGDFRVAVRSDGDILAAGTCLDTTTLGVQIVRLHAADGTEAWRYFSPGGSPLEEAEVLVALGDDAFIASRTGLVRLAAEDGSLVWQREEYLTGFRSFNALVDSTGRLFSAGRNNPDDSAVVRRYDPATGDMIWEATPYAGPLSLPAALVLATGNDGSLLSGWYSTPAGAAKIDAESGAVAWSRELDPVDVLEYPVGIVPAPDGSTFLGAFPAQEPSTWVVFKVGEETDTVFRDDFDE